MPDFTIPAHATNCHLHVVDDPLNYPTIGPVKTPQPAAIADFLRMLDTTGFERAVIVHPTIYGWDYSLLFDTIATRPAVLRGVAVAAADVSDAVLDDMVAHGVVALRFTEVRYRGGSEPSLGKPVFKDFVGLRQRMKERGLHGEFWSDCDNFVAQARQMAGDGVPMVLDHAGFFDASQGLLGADFQNLLALLREGIIWVKLTMHRNSKDGGLYQDVRPFHDALLAANPEQLVWGNDWPDFGYSTPFAPHFIQDLLLEWTADATLRQKILVENPARLYHFPNA